MPLSDTACRNAKPDTKPYKMGDAGGLYLQVTPTGSKHWRMKYRYLGKEKSLSFGSYPAVGLAEARAHRDEARKLLAANQDPSLVKKEKKRLQMIAANNTFEAVARKWHEKNKPKWSKNTASTTLRRLEMDVFPEIGDIPIQDIKTPRIAAIVEDIEKRGAGEVARRSLQYCRKVFAYAMINGLIEHNPADIKAADILTSVGSLQPLSQKPCEFICVDVQPVLRDFRAYILARCIKNGNAIVLHMLKEASVCLDDFACEIANGFRRDGVQIIACHALKIGLLRGFLHGLDIFFVQFSKRFIENLQCDFIGQASSCGSVERWYDALVFQGSRCLLTAAMNDNNFCADGGF